MFCRHCGKENQQQAKFCVYCGKQMQYIPENGNTVRKFCRTCGAALSGADGRCPNCQGRKKHGGRTVLIVMLCLVLVTALAIGVIWAVKTIDARREEQLVIPGWTLGYGKDSGKNSDKSTVPEDDAAQATLDPAETAFREAVAFCQDYEGRNRYRDIIIYLKEKVDSHPDDPRYGELLSDYEQLLQEKALQMANDLIEEGEYKQALTYLQTIQEVYTCEEIYGLAELCKGYLSQPLGWCPVAEDTNHEGTSSDVCLGDWEDVYGQMREDSVRYWVIQKAGYQNTEYAVYRMDRAYRTLTGEIVTEENSEEGSDAVIEIYLDGVLAYTSPTVSADSGAVAFELDVTGVSQIKVLCTTGSSSFNYCIVDAMLHEY